MEKYWYAALRDGDDNDWGTGSFDLEEAKEMARQFGSDALIAVIDGGYDEAGNQTTDAICVKKIPLEDF